MPKTGREVAPSSARKSAARSEKSAKSRIPVPLQSILDLRTKIEQMRVREGMNVLYTDRHLKLVAEVRSGKSIEAQPIDWSGKSTNLHAQQTMQNGKRWCIVRYD